MEKVIRVDILKGEDFYNKYDEDVVSDDFINYLVEQVKSSYIGNNVQIIVYNKCNLDKDIKYMLVDGLKRAYTDCEQANLYGNLIQLSFFVIGIILIFLSTKIGEESVWREVILISGWVPIWEAVNIALKDDNNRRRRKNILKRLIKSEIIINGVTN